MSMNLHLTVPLFGKRVEIPLHQTPTWIAGPDLTSAEYFRRYQKWLLGVAAKDPEYLREVEDHLQRVAFYCTHANHKWGYH